MKKLNLSITERNFLIKELDIIPFGDREEIIQIFKIIELLKITEDEKEKIGFKTVEIVHPEDVKKPEFERRLRKFNIWKKDKNKEFDLEDADFKLIKKHFEKLNRTKKLKKDRDFVKLYDKVMEQE